MKSTQQIRLVKGVVFLSIIGFLLFSLYSVDYQLLLKQLSQVGPHIFWILAISMTGQLVANGAWMLLFPPKELKHSFWQLALIRFAGEGMALINPASVIGGESYKAFLVQKTGGSMIASATSLMISRMLIMISAAILPVFAVPLLLSNAENPWILLSSAVVLLAGLLWLYWHIKNGKHKVSGFLYRASKFRLLGFLSKGARFLRKMEVDFHAFGEEYPRRLDAAFLLSLLHWLAGATEIMLIFFLLGFPVDIFYALALEGGLMLFKAVGFFIPAHAGAEEIGAKLLLEQMGGPGWLWVGFCILRRGRQLFWLLVGLALSAYFQFRIKKQTP